MASSCWQNYLINKNKNKNQNQHNNQLTGRQWPRRTTRRSAYAEQGGEGTIEVATAGEIEEQECVRNGIDAGAGWKEGTNKTTISQQDKK